MNLKRIAVAALAKDAATDSILQKHDRRFHSQGFDQEKGICKFREAREKDDEADVAIKPADNDRGLNRDEVVTLGNYYTGDLRDLAHRVKDGDAEAIAEAGKRLARILPKDAVLVPMPSHSGEPTTMRDLADAIAANAEGATVIDALRSTPHESSYEQKKRGEAPDAFEMRCVADIPKDREVYVVDNVIDTGATYGAAVRAIRDAHILALADTDRTPYSNGGIGEPPLKVRDITDKYESPFDLQKFVNYLEGKDE